ncbi:aminoglycoside phosphotransferase family protein [Pseudonocardia sp. H11422]|uniref:aminoglycoside phosphotransferase family protein n=1 Tax=Pseudonocardia sp. H11422 TaxID=2835866 RepID=UPI001BDDA74C|nr:aminoglycoside phosphotransferase family protein [Pseudonocardia sp. H11422]
MTSALQPAPQRADPRWPPSLGLLLGPAAADLLQVALDGYGGRLLSVRATNVGVQPGGSAVVQYTADVERADGRRTRETLAATTGTRIPDGAAVLAGEVDGAPVRVGLWRWPQDPALPGLAWAERPAELGRRLGLTGPPRVRVRVYRPGRRAVLEVRTGGSRMFLKIVRPGAVDALRRRHDLLTGHVPVPPVLAASDDGIAVLPALPGAPLRAVLLDGGALPSPAALDALLDRLPPAVAELPHPGRHAPADHLARVPHFTAVLGLSMPELQPRVDRLAADLRATDPGEHPGVPVHGDFYESQLLIGDGTITGLLDVDTCGRGTRIDEWATLLAHLTVLTGGHARDYGAALLAFAEVRWPRRELSARVAAALLALATGPFRVQQRDWTAHTERRIEQAEQWLARR